MLAPANQTAAPRHLAPFASIGIEEGASSQTADAHTSAPHRAVAENIVLPSARSAVTRPVKAQIHNHDPVNTHLSTHNACNPITPIKIHNLITELALYPNKLLAHYLINGFSHGFSIGYTGPPLAHHPANLSSAYDHPQVISSYVETECSLGHTAGPFLNPPFTPFNLNPLGAVPKKSGKWRLIMHLSHPPGSSVNDGIPVEEFSLHYISIDTAADAIMTLGRSCYLAKADIKSAFRICPVKSEDWPLLGFQWQGKFYFDRVLPFGLRSAPFIFNCLAEALCWILQHNYSVSTIMHYLDDYLTAGHSHAECEKNLHQLKIAFRNIGVPLAEEKFEGPASTISFLGILLDTERLEARLPEDKLSSIKELITEWLIKPSATKRELLSLIGHLSFAAKVVPPGRTFLRRMIDLSTSEQGLDTVITLDDSFCKDLHWWHSFLDSWNGRSLLLSPKWLANSTLQLFTDSSGSIGYGAYFQKLWFQGRWTPSNQGMSIQWKELFPIVLAAATWGRRWSTKRILFLCDNESVVAILRSGTSHSPEIMVLVRSLHLCAAKYQFMHSAKHIPGISNPIADALSRFKMQEFRRLAPDADPLPTIPTPPPSANI